MIDVVFLRFVLLSFLTFFFFLLFTAYFHFVTIRSGTRQLIWWLMLLRLLIPFGFRLPGVQLFFSPPDLSAASAIPLFSETVEVMDDLLPMSNEVHAALSHLSFIHVIAIIWVLGALIYFLFQTLGYRYHRRLLLSHSAPADQEYLELLQRVQSELGLRAKVSLLISSRAPSPLLIDIWHKKILLPPISYSQEDLALILRHELTHIARHDLLYKRLLLLVRGIHWFNPLLTFLQRQAALDMELSCDEAVLYGADSDQRFAYSHAILSSMDSAFLYPSEPMAGFQGGVNEMKRRLDAIYAKRSGRPGYGILIIAVILLLCIGFAVGHVSDAFPTIRDGKYDFGSYADTFRIRNQNVSVRFFPNDTTLDDFLTRFGLTPEEANPQYGTDPAISVYLARDCILFDETGDLPWSISVRVLEDGRIGNLSYSVSFWGVPIDEAMAQADTILKAIEKACGKGISMEEAKNTYNYNGMIINAYGDDFESLREPEHLYQCEYLFLRSSDVISVSAVHHAVAYDTTELYGEQYDAVFELTISTVINRE